MFVLFSLWLYDESSELNIYVFHIKFRLTREKKGFPEKQYRIFKIKRKFNKEEEDAGKCFAQIWEICEIKFEVMSDVCTENRYVNYTTTNVKTVNVYSFTTSLSLFSQPSKFSYFMHKMRVVHGWECRWFVGLLWKELPMFTG